MVTKAKPSQPSTERVFQLSLWRPFNTPLHRVGLAGLYMSLNYLKSLRGNVIDWNLTSESITLRWKCTDREALTWLLNHTYQFNNDSIQGLIKIPALGEISTDTAVTIHNGILSTFLQHPSSVGGEGIKKCTIQFDENQTMEVDYKAINRYNHQDLNPFTKTGLYDKQDYFLPYIRIAQWLIPGATEKHVAVAGGKTRLQELPEGFLSLLFAPIACSYYQVRSRLKANKYRWALIIPNIDNLEEFAKIRQTEGFQVANYRDYYASGLSDASLHYLLMLAGNQTIALQETPSCEVWAFGDVPWSQQQSITKHHTVLLHPHIRKRYEICDSKLAKGVKVGKNGTFIDVSFGREIVTENLVAEKPWYSGLHDVLKFNSEIFGRLHFEQQGLRDMQEAMISKQLTKEMATLFGDAFTWQLYEQRRELRRNTSSGNPNYDKLETDLLMSIRNCRSQQDFVRLQTSVFSRPTAVKNPFLQGLELGDFYLWAKQNWQDCLALMTLAIVGYQNPWKTPRTAAYLESLGKKSKYSYKKDDGSDDTPPPQPDNADDDNAVDEAPQSNPLLDED
jgi:CRISPR-associated protein Cas8a1/Csx13